jgi:hypothetical protein
VLSPNRDTAERRFCTLQKQLQQDDVLGKIYEEQMLYHAAKQLLELAPTAGKLTGVYLSHHAVKKKRRWKMKYRRVIDASSSKGNSPPINDVLYMDPNLLPEVLARYYVLADILSQ